MKSNYKITFQNYVLLRETNLMRPLTAQLEIGYCSIIIANHELMNIIIFVAKNYTHP